MFKEKLKEFIDNLQYVPIELRRQSVGVMYLDTNRTTIMLKLKNGNIILKENHKWHEYTFKTFFLKQRLNKCFEEDLIKNISEYLLFKKLKDNKLTAREIMNCKNLEIRRLLIDRFGYERFLGEMKGHTIHEDGQNKLVKIDWKSEEPIKLIRLKDSSTERFYVLRVPPSVSTCREAIAWTFGLREEEYKPLKET